MDLNLPKQNGSTLYHHRVLGVVCAGGAVSDGKNELSRRDSGNGEAAAGTLDEAETKKTTERLSTLEIAEATMTKLQDEMKAGRPPRRGWANLRSRIEALDQTRPDINNVWKPTPDALQIARNA